MNVALTEVSNMLTLSQLSLNVNQAATRLVNTHTNPQKQLCPVENVLIGKKIGFIGTAVASVLLTYCQQNDTL